MSILKPCTFSPDIGAARKAFVQTPMEMPGLYSGPTVQKKEAHDTYLLIRRTYRDGSEDFRLLGMIDLEDYSFHVGSGHPIRAAEGFSSIEEDAPPEVLPLLFLDDDSHAIIEPISAHIREYPVVFSLTRSSVTVDAFALSRTALAAIQEKLCLLSQKDRFKEKYSTDSDAPLAFAVGRDSGLSAAKRRWENKKREYLSKERENAGERFLLVEIQNIHSPHVRFAPIHRLYQGENSAALMDFFPRNAPTVHFRDPGENVSLFCPEREHTFRMATHLPAVSITAGILGRFVASHGGRVTPIRGKSLLRALSSAKGQVGILLPALRKESFFSGIIQDGILPGDSFIIEEHE